MTPLKGSMLPERFWNRVDPNGPVPEHAPELGNCWEWTGTKNQLGYGVIRMKGFRFKNHLTHRIMQFDQGRLESSNYVVDHLCHNASCVRPKHLRSVTRAQNIQNLRGAYSRSKTGVRGVSKLADGKYRAEACVGGKRTHIGRFAELEDAERAVIDWRRENMPHSYMDSREVAA